MPLDDRLHNRQPETASDGSRSAVVRLRPGRIGLVKTVEHVRQVLGRDSHPLVLDSDDDSRRRACVAVEFDAGRHRSEADGAATRRETDRVRSEILQRLLQAILIAHHDAGVVINVGLDRDAGLRQRPLVPLRDAREDLLELHRLVTQRAAAALEFREIEQVPDEVLEAPGFVADDPEIACPRLVIERDRKSVV